MLVRELRGLTPPHHVVGENDRAASRQRRGDHLQVGLEAAAVGSAEVTMRKENACEWARAVRRSVQGAGNVESRQAFEAQILRDIAVVGTLGTGDGVERRSLWKWIESGATQDAVPDRGGARMPCDRIGNRLRDRRKFRTRGLVRVEVALAEAGGGGNSKDTNGDE